MGDPARMDEDGRKGDKPLILDYEGPCYYPDDLPLRRPRQKIGRLGIAGLACLGLACATPGPLMAMLVLIGGALCIYSFTMGIAVLWSPPSPLGDGKREARAVVVVGVTLFLIGIVVVAVGMWLMERSYGRGGVVEQVRCASELRSVGFACAKYAQEHDGRFPPSLDEVRAELDLSDMRCSYVYVGAGLTSDSPASAVVAYEPLENHAGKGLHVLYADGQIIWLNAKAGRQFLANPPTNTPRPSNGALGP